MNRLLLLASTCSVLLASVGPLHGDEPIRPNFIVVLVDDLRWDELGCAGHPFVRTPNIDRLAAEGIRFRNAFCTTPLCSPVRACLLTGLHTHHHGILDNTNRSEDSHRLKTFPQVLKRSGYETAYVGKWHMGNDDAPRPGFDHWVSMQGQGVSFDPELNVDGIRKRHTGHTTDVLNRYAARVCLEATVGAILLVHRSQGALHPELTQRDDGSITDPTAAHFLPARRHRDLYKDEAIPRRLNVLDNAEDKPAARGELAGVEPLGRATGTSDETVRERLRMLAAVDEGVGQLLEALEARGNLDDTAIVFTGDHGYWYGEHGLSVERRLAYEEAIRVPLLIRYPRLENAARPGSVVDQLAISVDLAPTVLELARVQEPHPTDGRSLTPLLRGERPADWRRAFLIQYNSDTVFPRVHRMGYRAIRTEHWKLIRYTELEGMDELYDLRRDPYEMHNVAREPKLRGQIATLNRQLDELLQE